MQKIIDDEVQEMLQNGIIEPSELPGRNSPEEKWNRFCEMGSTCEK